MQICFYPYFVASKKQKPRIKIPINWSSHNKKYFCFLSMSSSIDSYNGIFLNVIHVRIKVPWSNIFDRAFCQNS